MQRILPRKTVFVWSRADDIFSCLVMSSESCMTGHVAGVFKWCTQLLCKQQPIRHSQFQMCRSINKRLSRSGFTQRTTSNILSERKEGLFVIKRTQEAFTFLSLLHLHPWGMPWVFYGYATILLQLMMEIKATIALLRWEICLNRNLTSRKPSVFFITFLCKMDLLV